VSGVVCSDQSGIAKHIVVYKKDQVVSGITEAMIAGGRRTQVLLFDDQIPAGRGQKAQGLSTAVGRAVNDHDDLELIGGKVLVEKSPDGSENDVAPVKGGHYDRNIQ
jgi:hypothetical protein